MPSRLFHTIWIGAVICLSAPHGLCTAAEVERIPVTGKIQWAYGYEEGQRVARETGKPMFVVFRCER